MTARFSDLFFHWGHDHAPTAYKYLCGLIQTERANMERMEEAVPGSDYQVLQQFLSDAPWDHRPVMDRVAQDANGLLGGTPNSALLLDETSMIKKGRMSAGVARQWSGRLGKVDNCQVAVFGVLNAGQRAIPVDARLFLPDEWIEDPARCKKAGIPEHEILKRTKIELALEIVRHQRALGVDFKWVCADGLYGNSPEFLRALDDDGEQFVIDVHSNQHVYLEDPRPGLPPGKGRGKPCSRLKSEVSPVRVDKYVQALAPEQWQRLAVRHAENGPLEILFYRRTVWLWDGQEAAARRWQIVVRRELDSTETKYALSNAVGDVADLQLAQVHAQRFWIERAFEDAKMEAGMADYQVRKWLAWHHHMALVMMVLLFMTRHRMIHAETLPLLSGHDIRVMLAFFLPRRDASEAEILRQLEIRHRKRAAARRTAQARAKPKPINKAELRGADD
jgi:SRSO17 transposase